VPWALAVSSTISATASRYREATGASSWQGVAPLFAPLSLLYGHIGSVGDLLERIRHSPSGESHSHMRWWFRGDTSMNCPSPVRSRSAATRRRPDRGPARRSRTKTQSRCLRTSFARDAETCLPKERHLTQDLRVMSAGVVGRNVSDAELIFSRSTTGCRLVF
jgi:hypothetical protein